MLKTTVSSDTADVYLLLVHYKMCFSGLELRLNKIQVLTVPGYTLLGLSRVPHGANKGIHVRWYKLHSSLINYCSVVSWLMILWLLLLIPVLGAPLLLGRWGFGAVAHDLPSQNSLFPPQWELILHFL